MKGIILAPSTTDLKLQFFSKNTTQNVQSLFAGDACCLQIKASCVITTLDFVSKMQVTEHTVGRKMERYQQNWTTDFGRIQQHFQIRNKESTTQEKTTDCFPTVFRVSRQTRQKWYLVLDIPTFTLQNTTKPPLQVQDRKHPIRKERLIYNSFVKIITDIPFS